MPPRRALEIRLGDLNSQKWRLSLTEAAFDLLMAHGGDAARKVLGEGSLFSPMLFGKFFDPADAFPLWEFESDVLLSGLCSGSKTSVEWFETNSDYVLRAQLPGPRKCDIEVSGDRCKVIDISGQWRGQESDARDWRTGRWWEQGYVRRLELPENANWKRVEAYVDDDSFLEIKIAKNISDSNIHQTSAAEPRESEFV